MTRRPFDDLGGCATRRSVIRLAAAAPLLAIGYGAAAAPVCFDLEKLPATQKNMRASLGFKPVSTDTRKHCSICNFYSASTQGCGTCALLSGGGVSENSVCDSWAAKV
jgi:hypothetical protein